MTTFLIFTFSTPSFPESYSNYRLDDASYKSGGRINPWGQSRLGTIEYETGSSITTNLYVDSRYSTQSRNANYAGRAAISPEVQISTTSSNFTNGLTVAPRASYKESNDGNTIVERKLDGDLIFTHQANLKSFSYFTQIGRGFQRLDSSGFLFSGFGNFLEFGIQKEKFGTTAQFLQDSNSRIYGGSLFYKSEQLFRIFAYKWERKGNFPIFFGEIEPSISLQYAGLDSEWNLSQFGKIDATILYSEGRYQNRIFSNFGQTNYNPLKAVLFYGSYSFQDWFRVGGLHTSKDTNVGRDQAFQGYQSIQSEVRVLGGRSSILLQENLPFVSAPIFGDWAQTTQIATQGPNLSPIQQITPSSNISNSSNGQKNFENLGLQMYGLEFHIPKDNWDFSILVNQASSALGKGTEGILRTQYSQKDSFFAIFSVTAAQINPERTESIFIKEITRPVSNYDSIRFYFSLGTKF